MDVGQVIREVGLALMALGVVALGWFTYTAWVVVLVKDSKDQARIVGLSFMFMVAVALFQLARYG